MASEKLPKLPPGKRVEQVLAMREADFAEAARFAGMPPEKLRDTLQKILARSSEAGQREATVKSEQLRESRAKKRRKGTSGVVTWEASVIAGIRLFLHEDFRDKSEAEETAAFSAADQAAEKLATRTDREQPRYAWDVRADSETVDLYESAYKIQLMRSLEKFQAEHKLPFREAHAKVVRFFADKELGINLLEERHGLSNALVYFRKLVLNDRLQARAIYDAYRNNTLTASQKKFIEEQRDAAIRNSWGSELTYIVRNVFLENGLMNGHQDRSGIPVSGQVAGLGGAFSYYPHSRPHRDDYGSSGGEDDK